MIAAPAGVKTHAIGGNVAQAVIKRVDAQLGVLAVFRHAHLRHELPAVGQIGIVDLQQKPRVDDRLIFFVHGVGDGDEISLVVGVVIVFHPMLDGAGSNRGKKCFFVFLALKPCLEIFDFRF